MLIKQEETGSKGAFVAYEENKKIGEMSYSIAGTDKIIVDHTEVDPEQKGKSIGKILLQKVVEHARDNNLKIIPLCPFAKAMFEKNIDIRDVLA
ncbi:GNAT family N-acetyltransferase [Sphingobacterium faecale]|uniref:N-acetyltransferase n=1 Tax=Sphingobacterium faecale TaxID=2803775 RepID=A0ABS1R3S5_9SPHI|nr:GNAT family N-acetyltransferase [Sphingobacterium faecale]MBL1409199.1 N-acetyltransferase [Sphingobacterium faecale]